MQLDSIIGFLTGKDAVEKINGDLIERINENHVDNSIEFLSSILGINIEVILKSLIEKKVTIS